MSAPAVSVVIPVHDDERHLSEAVSSARSQDIDEDVEIIVVDDGSPVDPTGMALSAGADRAVRMPSQQGPSLARDVGISLARAPIIAMLDSDDMMVPSRLRRQAEWLDSHKDMAGVIAHQRVVLEAGAEAPAWLDPTIGDEDAGGAVGTSMMVRATALRLHGGFDPSLRMAEDIEVLMRLERGGCRIGRIEEPMVIRRVHGRNATYDNEAMWAGLLRAVRTLTARLPGPQVSVLVPAYNAERYLEEAVCSAVAQEGPSLEVIIIDDGSDDATMRVASHLAVTDDRVRAFAAPHCGTGAARNLGLLLARGRLIALLDADDVWPPGRLAVQAEELDSPGAPDLVFGSVEEFVSPESAGQAGRTLGPSAAVCRAPGGDGISPSGGPGHGRCVHDGSGAP